MERLAVLLPLLPLISAVLVTLLADRLQRRVARLSIGLGAATVAVAVAGLVGYLVNGDVGTLGGDHGWGSMVMDPLAHVMATLVAAISLVVHVYARRYMAEEPGYARFYALLDAMTAAILLMVTAGDLITLLVAWHLVGVCLYFLLGHDTERAAPQRYAFWTFFTYRMGDLPLVLAAILLYQAYGTWSLPAIFDALSAAPDAHTVLGFGLPDVVALLVALAAFARSAQFPLHTWLPYTMEGPTPVSALMHAGIVNAGGFILNRFAPVFVHSGEVLHLVFAVGLITAILGSVLMLTQNDIKKALGYSTMGQMGFMFVEVGVGAFSLAIYHLIAHGLFKGTMFLGAGGVIGDARRHDGVPHEDVYTFVVERRPASSRLPWLVAGVLTVLVPFAILGLSHWVVDGGAVGQQGALVLLFFGWVTGAQLILSTYRLRAENPLKLMAMIIISLAVVVAGYTLIEHAFDLLLYPNRALSEGLYAAASVPMWLFGTLVAVLTLAVMSGWTAAWYAQSAHENGESRSARLRLMLYSLISREFYVADVYTRLTQIALGLSKRLNVWARWV